MTKINLTKAKSSMLIKGWNNYNIQCNAMQCNAIGLIQYIPYFLPIISTMIWQSELHVMIIRNPLNQI